MNMAGERDDQAIRTHQRMEDGRQVEEPTFLGFGLKEPVDNYYCRCVSPCTSQITDTDG